MYRRHEAITLLNVLMLLVALTGCDLLSTSASSPTPTPVLQFTTLDPGLPPQALNAPIIGTVPDTQMLYVDVALKVNQATLSQLGTNYSHAANGASVSNVAQKLGISDQQLLLLQSYFTQAHISVKVSKTRTNLTFDAHAGDVARLLQTRFVTHQLNGRQFFTPDPAKLPRVPTAIATSILVITGLDNYGTPPLHTTALTTERLTGQRIAHRGNADCLTFAPSIASPTQIARAYGYDRFWDTNWHGENMTVNLVESDGFMADDLSNYLACTNSQARLDVVNMGDRSPDPKGEATLDIEMLAGLAPNIHIVDYQQDPALTNSDGSGPAPWRAFLDALQQILDNNQGNPHPGSTVSISLGGIEATLPQNILQALNQDLQLLTQAEDMTVFVSSGDCGAYNQGKYGGPIGVDFPASSPWAVAVGGTQMSFTLNSLRSDEVVWSSRADLSACKNRWGSGGGLSSFFDRMAFQQGPGVVNNFSTGKRQVPDVAAVAINLPIYYQGQWGGAGGTSAASPIWAAGMALVNEGLIIKKHLFYYGPLAFYSVSAHAGRLHPYYDVVSGDNLYYHATPGWDYATGLGTPNLVDFITVLSNMPS